MSQQTIAFLKLSLHGRVIGYLAGWQQGKNILTFTPEFSLDPYRPTMSLTTHPDFLNSDKSLAKQWVHHQRLHPILSNLLPEGALRQLVSQAVKVHSDNEFQILSYLGRDLPGALVAEPVYLDDIPSYVLSEYKGAQLHSLHFDTAHFENRFSLAGVQVKFSMLEQNGRYTLSNQGLLGDWIVKTPSPHHKSVPQNEYTAMMLAKLAGVNIPEIKLVEMGKLDNLPYTNMADDLIDKPFAYAIKRFDRDNTEGSSKRIHSEDFAQVLVKYPHEKYNGGNYTQIAKILNDYCVTGLEDVQQFARRLLVNILLANGDAHLKNWSLIYPDMVHPRLSPAYDIVFTKAYIDNEQSFALNLGKTKSWYEVNFSHFEYWAKKAGIPWRVIAPHLQDTLERARALWNTALDDLPMDAQQKVLLRAHWKGLHSDFRI